MDPAPTLGLITGKDLTFGDHLFATTYLRSNISIYSGESGAPVFDSNGRLCGVLIASVPELHSSFIIPTVALGRVFNDIIQHKSVQYSSAGFRARNQPTAEFGKTQMIISAIQTSTIQYQGTETLQIGDVLLKIEDKTITNERDIADVLFFKKPKEHCRIEVLRHKKTILVELVLGEKIL
jgi:S1-C subfamily serine protease